MYVSSDEMYVSSVGTKLLPQEKTFIALSHNNLTRVFHKSYNNVCEMH